MQRPFIILSCLGAAGCGSRPACTGDCVEICDNGVDDDGDGLTDCEDVEACPGRRRSDACYVEPPGCSADSVVDMPEIVPNTVSAPFRVGDMAIVAQERIGEPGDRDCYVLNPTAGTLYVLHTHRANDDLDAVLQLFDSDLELIGVNDDLPYRITETDSGLELFAQSDAPLYVEVLAFEDWKAKPGGSPGDRLRYDLLASAVVGHEPNEADNETVTQAAANLDDDDDDTFLDPYRSRFDWLHGRIDVPSDVDVVPYRIGESLTYEGILPRICQWSTFGLSGLEPLLEVFREDCNWESPGSCTGEDATLVATTRDPVIDTTGRPAFFSADAGITFPVRGRGAYYLRITDPQGGGSERHGYTIFAGCAEPALTPEEENGGSSAAEATPVEVTDPRHIRMVGTLDGSELGMPDTVDAFRVADEVRAGRFVDLLVETTTAGSRLADATVTLWQDNGLGLPVELVTVSGPDAAVDDLELPSGEALYLTIESESAVEGPDAFYLARMSITDGPGGLL